MGRFYREVESVKELLKLIGYDDTVSLMEKRGGTNMDIPVNPERAAVLLEMVSPSGVAKLCEYYRGDRVYIPKVDELDRQKRNREIIKNSKDMSVRELALTYQLSYRQIQNILAEKRGGRVS